MLYLLKTPSWLRLLYKKCIWSIESDEKVLYLTFDDGPHPVATAFVLDELKKANAKATFFCIGKNVESHPDLYQRILDEGHAVGNHTQNHLNGWKVKDAQYLDDIEAASKYIDSNLFRPPYGKITGFQARQLRSPRFNMHTVMWSVLSGDFDTDIKPERCLANVTLHSFPGAIVVFHDSEKAFMRLQYALPATLKYFSEKGYRFEKIVLDRP